MVRVLLPLKVGPNRWQSYPVEQFLKIVEQSHFIGFHNEDYGKFKLGSKKKRFATTHTINMLGKTWILEKGDAYWRVVVSTYHKKIVALLSTENEIPPEDRKVKSFDQIAEMLEFEDEDD